MGLQKRNLWILLLVVMLLLALISFTGEDRDDLTRLEHAVFSLLVPVQDFFADVGQSIQSFFDAFLYRHEIKAENERLREEFARYQEKILTVDELRSENQRLREMLDFQSKEDEELVPAEVVARDPSQWFNTITLNRGTRHGIEAEMPVITPHGLVGMVSNVSRTSCQVILLTDPRLPASAMVQRSRDPGTMGIIEGYAEEVSLLEFINIPHDADVKEQDRIVTSGLGGIFPKGIAIGIVEDVELDESGLVQNATVQAHVNFNRLEEVFIVVPESN